jgi:hydrogenase nickel incorporation protein HypA/HybF
MHEASHMIGLMQKITELTRREDAKRVVRVSVWLGALSHVSAEHFHQHFAHAAVGTPAEGAAVELLVSADLDDENAESMVLRSIDVELKRDDR